MLVAPAHLAPERRRRAWLDADPQAPGRAGAFAVEAVALGGPVSLVEDAGRMASELVASAIRPTDAPVELTVDAGDDMVRIEVRDDDAIPAAAGRLLRAARGLDRRLTGPAPRPMRRAGRLPRGPSRRR